MKKVVMIVSGLTLSTGIALAIVTNIGQGESVIAIQPALAREQLRDTIEAALCSDLSTHVQPSADSYQLRIRFKNHGVAYEKSFYPGAVLDGFETVVFESEDFYEIARFLKFMG